VAASVLGHAIVLTAATTTPVDVCVGVLPLQASADRGQTAAWAVGAWTTGGNVPDVKLQLEANPASAGTPRFTFGCGKGNGTATCDLGAVDVSAAQRIVEAQVPVPLTATTVTSVSLTATGTAANMRTDPAAAASITILGPTAAPIGTTSALPISGLPGVTAPTGSSTLDPGGNASGLFPTLAPQTPDPSAEGTAKATGTKQVANTSAFSGGSNTLGAQVAGLIALALAAIFAITRISLRRPSHSSPATPATPAAGGPPKDTGGEAAKPAEAPPDVAKDAEATAAGEPAADPPAAPETQG
jgi:hypothetical protein